MPMFRRDTEQVILTTVISTAWNTEETFSQRLKMLQLGTGVMEHHEKSCSDYLTHTCTHTSGLRPNRNQFLNSAQFDTLRCAGRRVLPEVSQDNVKCARQTCPNRTVQCLVAEQPTNVQGQVGAWN